MDKYLADTGTRKEFFLKLEKRILGPSYTIHTMIDRNNRKAMFYNYKSENDLTFQEGDCVLVKATVAEHRVYKDVPQTYLNRVILLENKGTYYQSLTQPSYKMY
jgi:hypothetical protein|tara:strand:+ start:54 stop:365 length:312 start_codon:yes stop_codon:yes gene_type:complete